MRDFSRGQVVPGTYLRYDKKKIQVILVTKDCDTGEEIVLCRDEEGYFAIKERSFRGFAEVGNKMLEKFTYIGDISDKNRRIYRGESTYLGYAKDLCEHYMEDMRKLNLCVTEKRYFDLSKEELLAIKEDLAFLQNCLKTVLRPYSDYFKGRYVQELSIRKYAEAQGINRGSVHHTQKKLYAALAEELKSRDEADGICRLRLAPRVDFEGDL